LSSFLGGGKPSFFAVFPLRLHHEAQHRREKGVTKEKILRFGKYFLRISLISSEELAN
jgi:hypothetical protein